MPIINEVISRAKRQGSTVTLKFDEGEPIELHGDLIARRALRKGDMIPQEEIEGLLAESTRLQCREAAWGMISRKPRTSKELLAGLRKKGFVQELAQKIVEDLIEKGFVQDELLAETIAQEKFRKGKGSGFILRDLQARGIHREKAEEIVADLCSDESEKESGRNLLQKWNRRKNPTDPIKRKKAAIGFLSRRGFPAELVYELVREVLGKGG